MSRLNIKNSSIVSCVCYDCQDSMWWNISMCTHHKTHASSSYHEQMSHLHITNSSVILCVLGLAWLYMVGYMSTDHITNSWVFLISRTHQLYRVCAIIGNTLYSGIYICISHHEQMSHLHITNSSVILCVYVFRNIKSWLDIAEHIFTITSIYLHVWCT